MLRCVRNVLLLTAALVLTRHSATGQSAVKNDNNSVEALRAEMQEMRKSFEELKAELAAARREAADLRRDLNAMRQQGPNASEPALKDRIVALEEQQGVTAGKVDDQYQSKIESGSKYRVRLSGTVLFNAMSTRGDVDQLDMPTMVDPGEGGEKGGGVGANLRQSQIGLEVFGPGWLGAKTSGDVRFDFFAGFPASPEGLTSGLARLRTAKIALDWKNTSIVGGQEAPFFSPLSPSSLLMAGYPSFSNAGNLWTWAPELYIEHRIGSPEQLQFTLQGGFLDPLTGEVPASEYERKPTAGERSRTPGFAARVGLQHTFGDQRLSAGAGAYRAKQDWNYGREVDSWAVTGDWDVPLGRVFAWSGELYRGRAIGGLGGGPNASVVFSGPTDLPTSAVLPLISNGGWTQLKFQPTQRWQFNSVFGQDSTSGNGLERASTVFTRRNAAAMFNVIFQARSNLLFSTEYRHLWTRPSAGRRLTADHVTVGAGVFF